MAVFHTVFNASNVLLLLPFVSWLVRRSRKSVKSEDDDAEEFKLKIYFKRIFKRSFFGFRKC
ncbi:MAG: hypothetical protein R2836_05560 [Chitinophagales bacterium]